MWYIRVIEPERGFAMKRVFAALGKALVYFLIFLVTQTVVTILYSGAYAIVLLPDTSDPYLLAEELLAHLDPALLLSNLVIILIYLLIAPMRRRSPPAGGPSAPPPPPDSDAQAYRRAPAP